MCQLVCVNLSQLFLSCIVFPYFVGCTQLARVPPEHPPSFTDHLGIQSKGSRIDGVRRCRAPRWGTTLSKKEQN
ncbi:hypothetical protein RB195_012770 [Necator americanus]|uniref:Secreted protein n=1 Tax=Necator americanus TaxID=51031 RepID=A0ABR1DSZ9_NECAM